MRTIVAGVVASLLLTAPAHAQGLGGLKDTTWATGAMGRINAPQSQKWASAYVGPYLAQLLQRGATLKSFAWRAAPKPGSQGRVLQVSITCDWTWGLDKGQEKALWEVGRSGHRLVTFSTNYKAHTPLAKAQAEQYLKTAVFPLINGMVEPASAWAQKARNSYSHIDGEIRAAFALGFPKCSIKNLVPAYGLDAAGNVVIVAAISWKYWKHHVTVLAWRVHQFGDRGVTISSSSKPTNPGSLVKHLKSTGYPKLKRATGG